MQFYITKIKLLSYETCLLGFPKLLLGNLYWKTSNRILNCENYEILHPPLLF